MLQLTYIFLVYTIRFLKSYNINIFFFGTCLIFIRLS